MPALIARDWVMEQVGCEREKSAALLMRAAVHTLQFDSRVGSWEWTPNHIIHSITDFNFVEASNHINRIREAELDEGNRGSALWLAWCDRAKVAVILLRELTAVEVSA